jgi:hypothetical protein
MEQPPEPREPLPFADPTLAIGEEEVTMTPEDTVAVRNHMRALMPSSTLRAARQLAVHVDVYPGNVTISILMRHGVRGLVLASQQIVRELADWVCTLSLPSQYGRGRWNVCMPYPNESLITRNRVLLVELTPIRRRALLVRWQVNLAGNYGFRYTEHRGANEEDENPTGGPLNSGVSP